MMRKFLLVGALLAPAFLFAQVPTVPKTPASAAVYYPKKKGSYAVDHNRMAPLNKKSPVNGAGFREAATPNAVNYKVLGTTKYDLQTNASVGRRIIVYPDGKISAVWTTASDESPWALRGTGYVHYNGTSWSTSSARIEPVRTGWPTIGNLGSEEFVIGHTAEVGGFRLSKNSSIGSTNWTTSGAVLNETVGKPIWGRAANVGNTIYMIANYSDSSSDEPTNIAPTRKGVRAPMLYSRSTDGGQTWADRNILLPGYDSTILINGGGDCYAIDAKDSVVAIIAGGLGEHLILWKSTDFGVNFTRTIIDSVKYAPINTPRTVMKDTVRSNDGSMDVLIDHNLKVHVFYGGSGIFDVDTVDDGYNFFPSSAFLCYWNEITNKIDSIGAILDKNNNAILDISASTWASATSANVASAARYGNTSLVTMPSVGIDAQGRIFCLYSAPVEGSISIDNENYRDVWVIYSTDGGDNWAQPQNLTNTSNREEAFACIGKLVDSKIHFIYQFDINPGTELQNSDAPGSNDIVYGSVNVSEILANTIGPGSGVGIKELNNVFKVNSLYPNPATGMAYMNLNLFEGSTVNVTMTDILGRTVSSNSYDNLTAEQDLAIDLSSVHAGVYMVKVEAAGFSEVVKLIVQ